MLNRCIAALTLVLFIPEIGAAQTRQNLGFGRLISNDFLGDGQDRWRTGGVQSSWVWGPDWNGSAPSGIGQVLEFRLGAEILAPDDIQTPAQGDRPYAGALSFGLHTHVSQGQIDYSAGIDIVFVGPQTGLDAFQDAFHDAFSIARPSVQVRDAQIENQIIPSAVIEAGRVFDLGKNSALRPFVEARIGVETLVRTGLDFTFGDLGRGELLARDSVTGQHYRVIQSDWTGFSFTAGADVAYVTDSAFLPAERNVQLEDMRARLRAGVMWQGPTGATAFYGVTYLSEEFESQDEGQVIGSIRVRVPF